MIEDSAVVHQMNDLRRGCAVVAVYPRKLRKKVWPKTQVLNRLIELHPATFFLHDVSKLILLYKPSVSKHNVTASWPC